MLLLVALNVLFIFVLSTKSEYYETFVSKETRLLNDGNAIPLPVFGSYFRVDEFYEVPQAVSWAIQSGFRHFDTAEFYCTEYLIGRALNNATSCGAITRKQLYVTAQLPLDVNRGKNVVPALKLTLKRLQLDYVDLFLLQNPYNLFLRKKFDLMDIWRGMEEAKCLGLAKSIGVTNFKREHLNLLLPYCTTTPAVNLIEVSPTFTNIDLVEFCQKHAIIVLSYAPFGFLVPRPGVKSGSSPSLDDPVLVKIANKYGVTTGQVVLRYMIDRGTIPVSRSTNKKHISSNRDIIKFSLTDEEVERINKFNTNKPVHPIENLLTLTDCKTRVMNANRKF